MKISCHDLHDFIRNMEQGSVFGNRVHINRSVSASDEAGLFKDIYLQSSAVLEYDDETQVLLECGVYCGKDIDTADGTSVGSDQYDDLHTELMQYCDSRDVKLLPGILDL